MDSESVLSISQLTDSIRNCLNGEYAKVVVSGEISELTRPQSGHVYLTLKDDFSQLSAILWRSSAQRQSFDPQVGVQVLCSGYIDVYPARGNYQLIVQQIAPLGEGALQLAFRKLHQRLKSEGLFDSTHKKLLPDLPQRILVITSPTGAAIQDFIGVIQRRWPYVNVMVCPVKVQGPGAAEEIAAAINRCSSKFDFDPDVMVVTRGGGSLEDLWAFNEEPVVRAVFDCPIPVVSAVGHEIDVTLCDLVADHRALTPTEAAEILVPDQDDVTARLDSIDRGLERLIRQRLNEKRDLLAGMVERGVLRQPMQIVNQYAQQVDSLDVKLTQLARRRFDLARQQLLLNYEKMKMSAANLIPQARNELTEQSGRFKHSLQARLQKLRQGVQVVEGKLKAFNPDNVLARGYSLTVDESGQPLTSCQNVAAGDKIQTWLGTGKLTSRIEEVQSEKNYKAHGQEKDT